MWWSSEKNHRVAGNRNWRRSGVVRKVHRECNLNFAIDNKTVKDCHYDDKGETK